MKPGLTVAIPTHDSWEGFLRGQLPVYLNHPLVSEVVVCDETGNDIIHMYQEGWIPHPKLHIYQNDTILGPYENMRQCFMKAKTEWVAVLGSNNLFGPDFIEGFFNCIHRSGEKKKTVYCAGMIERFLPWKCESENRTAHFNGMTISKANWNMILQMREWKLLLNSGNMIWPTKVRRHFKEFPSRESTDGIEHILLIRQAIQAAYRMSVEPTLHYVYTVIDKTGDAMGIFTEESMKIL